jgi:spore germination protein GerM
MCRPTLATVAALAAALAAAAVLAGCGDGASSSTAAPPASAAEVTVWFADEAGALTPETRPAPAGAASPLEAALLALAEGPTRPELLPALPPGARVLGAGAAGGVATVDLSREFETGYPAGGSAAELAVLGPLVRTAAEAAGAERVRVLVEGRAPAPDGGQVDLSEPLSPADVAAAG